MPSYQDVTREIGDQWVAALKRTEDALASVAQGVRDRVDLPQIPVPDRLSRLNDALSDRVPLPSELVKANFELTERLLAAQRDLTLRLLGASEEAAETPAPKPAAKKTASAK
jgi:hypothetical protein